MQEFKEVEEFKEVKEYFLPADSSNSWTSLNSSNSFPL